jgi:hypothetical protein
MQYLRVVGSLLFLCSFLPAHSQTGGEIGRGADSSGGRIVRFPTKVFGRIQKKTSDLDQQLTGATEKYVASIERREAKLQAKIAEVDPAGASKLFGSSAGQYSALMQKLRNDSGRKGVGLQGEYQPYVDSVNGILAFLKKNPQLMGGSGSGALAQLQGSTAQFQQLQAKFLDANGVKQYIQQRKQAIADYLSSHSQLAGNLGKEYQGISRDLYYYSESVRQYKTMLNDPDRLEQQALQVLNKLPAFQIFMKNNSQLAGLFGVSSGYGLPQGLAGLQSRDQVGQMIQSQVASGGAQGSGALQANLQSAQSQLDGFKDKLNKLGSGSGDMEMPDFKPNEQKTKSFWKRIEYGANLQTSRTNAYYPAVADMGLSIGYRLWGANTIGVGASYKLGLGNGWNHIAFSSQGVGLRSFADVKVKGSFFFSGGMELNYTQPFSSFQKLPELNLWTLSGLAGVSKVVSLKNRTFKQTKVSLLWDFLSYQQVPKTQPILFRVGYTF